MTRRDPRILAGGADLLDFHPEAEAERLVAAASRGETHAARWRRHVDGTGGDILRVRTSGVPPLAVVNSHNMAFYVWEEAVRRGFVRSGAHAVHVDYHPDFFDPEEIMPAYEGREQSLRIARGLRWNDWIAAAFARGAIARLTDVSLGDFETHRPPFVAVPVAGGVRFLEAGQDRGDPHPWLLRHDAPVPGRFRLRREGGLAPGTIVFRGSGLREAPRDVTEALALVEHVAREGDRLEVRGDPTEGLSIRLEAGISWILALAPGDESTIPPPLSARFDVEGTESDTGVALRRLRRDVTTLETLSADPPAASPNGIILDVDLDWLNVHRETDRPDEETVTPDRVNAFVRLLRRAVPDPGVVTVALSPDCLSPTIQARDLAEAGLSLVTPPPEHLGMQEGRRRLAMFLRAWRREYG